MDRRVVHYYWISNRFISQFFDKREDVTLLKQVQQCKIFYHSKVNAKRVEHYFSEGNGMKLLTKCSTPAYIFTMTVKCMRKLSFLKSLSQNVRSIVKGNLVNVKTSSRLKWASLAMLLIAVFIGALLYVPKDTRVLDCTADMNLELGKDHDKIVANIHLVVHFVPDELSYITEYGVVTYNNQRYIVDRYARLRYSEITVTL